MKHNGKILSFLIMLICVVNTSFFAFAESSEETIPMVVFDDIFYEDTISGNKISKVEYLTEDGISFLRIYANKEDVVDPFIYLPVGSLKTPVSCREYFYLLIRIRTTVAGNDSRLYFGTSVEPGLDENKSLPFFSSFNGNGKWETAVVEFKYSAHYDGLVHTIRLDPYGSWPENLDYIDIAWFGFVKSAKDLDSFGYVDPSGEDVYVYTREPVFATPDRTKAPAKTPEADFSDNTNESSEYAEGGNLSLTLIITAVCVILFAGGIILLKKTKK